ELTMRAIARAGFRTIHRDLEIVEPGFVRRPRTKILHWKTHAIKVHAAAGRIGLLHDPFRQNILLEIQTVHGETDFDIAWFGVAVPDFDGGFGVRAFGLRPDENIVHVNARTDLNG